jgi:uncharacterized protein (AIM24 family)
MELEVVPGIVPSVLATLGPSESVFSEHGIVLDKEDPAKVDRRTIPSNGFGSTLKRTSMGGVPFFLAEFTGPGRAAFSRNGPGEVRVMELASGEVLDVAEHSLLLASLTVTYEALYVPGTGRIGRRVGFWMDRLTGPGTIVVHGHGNVLSFTLALGETFDVDHGGVLLKDDRIQMESFGQSFGQSLGGGLLGSAMSSCALRIHGPGRLGLQTMDPSHPHR